MRGYFLRVALGFAALIALAYLWAALFPPGPTKPAQPKQPRPTATSGFVYCDSYGDCQDSEDR